MEPRTIAKGRYNDLTMNAVIAALYITLTIINPIGHGAIQIRLSEALCVLPFFDRKYIKGIVIGVAIANAFSPLGVADVAFGVAVVLISYAISYFVKNIWINIIQYSVVAGLLIGIELYIVFNLPFMFSFFSITASTFIIATIGAMFIKLLRRSKVGL